MEMKNKKWFALLVLIMATVSVVSVDLLISTPAHAAVRAAVGKPLQAALASVAAGDYSAAIEHVHEAESAGGLTDEELRTIKQVKDYVKVKSGGTVGVSSAIARPPRVIASTPDYASLRAQVGKPLQAAIAAANIGNYSAALTHVREAETVKGLSAEERKVIAQTRQYIKTASLAPIELKAPPPFVPPPDIIIQTDVPATQVTSLPPKFQIPGYTAASASPQTYRNAVYGFELTLPAGWTAMDVPVSSDGTRAMFLSPRYAQDRSSCTIIVNASAGLANFTQAQLNASVARGELSSLLKQQMASVDPNGTVDAQSIVSVGDLTAQAGERTLIIAGVRMHLKSLFVLIPGTAYNFGCAAPATIFQDTAADFAVILNSFRVRHI